MIPASQRSNRSRCARPRTPTATPVRYRMQIANTIKRYCVFYFSRNYILSNFITRRYRLAVAHRRLLACAHAQRELTRIRAGPTDRPTDRMNDVTIAARQSVYHVNLQKLTLCERARNQTAGESGGLKWF